jgi:flagellar hook capping protein FlgD
MLFETAPDVRPAATYRILVRLERVPSDAGSGIVRIQGVKAGTSAGASAAISLFNPTFDVAADVAPAPALLGARPNPTSGVTEVAFSLPADARATLRVYDVAGRLVRTLAEGSMTAGVHRARWDGLDARGRLARSGIYFAKLEVGRAIQSERILLLR